MENQGLPRVVVFGLLAVVSLFIFGSQIYTNVKPGEKGVMFYTLGDGLDTEKIMEEIREKIGNFPGVSITIGKDSRGPPVGTAIHLEISGSDYSKLIDLVEEVKNYINESSISGIEKLTYDLSTRKPELLIDFDRDKLRRYGLSTGMLANELRTSLFGKDIATFKKGDKNYDVALRFGKEFRGDIDALLDQKIIFLVNKSRDTSGEFHKV